MGIISQFMYNFKFISGERINSGLIISSWPSVEISSIVF